MAGGGDKSKINVDWAHGVVNELVEPSRRPYLEVLRAITPQRRDDMENYFGRLQVRDAYICLVEAQDEGILEPPLEGGLEQAVREVHAAVSELSGDVTSNHDEFYAARILLDAVFDHGFRAAPEVQPGHDMVVVLRAEDVR